MKHVTSSVKIDLEIVSCEEDGEVYSAGGVVGEVAIPLWSTVRISNQPIDEYVTSEKHQFERKKIEIYIKHISKFIIDNIRGTEYGPAVSFRDTN